MLVAAPVVLGVGMLLLGALFRRHQRADAALSFDRRPVLIAMGATTVGAAATSAALADTQVLNWALTALFLYGCSYLTLLLVTWRYWLAKDPARAFTWAWLPVTVVQLVPAILMAAGGLPGNEVVAAVWVFPGYFGIPTLVAIILAFVEASKKGRT